MPDRTSRGIIGQNQVEGWAGNLFLDRQGTQEAAGKGGLAGTQVAKQTEYIAWLAQLCQDRRRRRRCRRIPQGAPAFNKFHGGQSPSPKAAVISATFCFGGRKQVTRVPLPRVESSCIRPATQRGTRPVPCEKFCPCSHSPRARAKPTPAATANKVVKPTIPVAPYALLSRRKLKLPSPSRQARWT